MTKILKSKMKYCRTTGCNIFGSKKFKNNTPPGQHGKTMKKPTEYCIQIRETKKLRLFYGNLKLSYIKTIYDKISKIKGNPVDELIKFLERRLSTVVFRAKFAQSIFSAKQLISHGFILVNNKKVDISSYLLKPNDVVSLASSIRNNHHVLTSLSSTERGIPPFLDCSKNFEIIVLEIPNMKEDLFPCKMKLQRVIEFISK
jgi:small subunit ribosomal protein S4